MSLQETMAAVAAEVGDKGALFELMGLRFDQTPLLRPSTDYLDGHLYMTVPIQRNDTKVVGRGKAAKEVSRDIWTLLAIRDDGEFFLYEDEPVNAAGFRYPSTVTNPTTQRWNLQDMQRWLQGDRPRIEPADLFEEVRAVYRTYVEYPDDIYYDIVPLFALGSYVFRLFSATGYIHFNGTMASGKSQNLRVLSAIALNPTWTSNITPASLFRMVAGAPGVICVDEAESFESEKGIENRQLLLSGYAAGAVANRTEKGENDRFVVVPYDVYSPKVIASINPLDPTLASRCIVVPMAPAIRAIPEFNPESPEILDLRDRIYRWALQEGANIAALRDTYDLHKRERLAPQIKSRAWEVAQQYIVMSEHVGGIELVQRVVPFFDAYFAAQAKSREEADRQYLLLKCLPRVLSEKHPHPGFYYSLKDIHDVVSAYLEEDAREYYKTKQVGRHLTVLGFKDRQQAKGGTLAYLSEERIRLEFAKRHVTPFDEDVEWLEQRTNYQDPNSPFTAPGQTEPLPERFSWIDELESDDA
jgi:hypothetical protein